MYHVAIGAAPAGIVPPRRYWRWAVLVALGVVALTLALHWHDIATLAYPDMDDELRLVEVRDWLGGQGFYDVSQHRMNLPAGGPMHWSRLVDMPLAATILALRPLLGAGSAELVATIAVPLATLAAMVLLGGAIARRLAGDRAGLAATALGGMAVAATVQAQPLRIDHHGWEIVFSLLATLGLLSPRAGRGAAVAGAAIAVALQISLEALPYAIALGGVAALRWWRRPDPVAAARLRGYMLALATAEAALFLALRAPADLAGHCDAVSPPHLLGLALAAGGVVLACRFARRGRSARGAALVVVAALAALAFRAVPPHCGADAFSALEPIVRVYWYDQVNEGLPVWRQGLLVATAAIGFPLVALACAGVALRTGTAGARERWLIYAMLLAAATLVAMMVQRAGGLANALAVPAAAWAMVALVTRAQRDRRAAVRVLGSVGAVAILSPLAPVGAIDLLPARITATGGVARSRQACNTAAAVRRLAALPPAPLLAPFDIGPAILLETRDAILASGHHRNHAAMAEELRAWLGSDEAARAVMRRHGLAMVALCPDLAEVGLYREAAPHGFAAHLAGGEAPSWLAPVPLSGTPIRIWRVIG